MLGTLKLFYCYIKKITIWKKYNIGKRFHAGKRVKLWAKRELHIGDNFYIGRDSQIECDCLIGKNVIMGNHVSVVGKYDHHYQQLGCAIRNSSQIRDEDYNWKGLSLKTTINNDVWIGYGSIILSGVNIGTGSIVAAGSVVTKDIEEYSIYAGNPAKKICNRFNSEADLEKHKILLEGVGNNAKN